MHFRHILHVLRVLRVFSCSWPRCSQSLPGARGLDPPLSLPLPCISFLSQEALAEELCHLDTLRRRRRTHTSAQSCATWTLSGGGGGHIHQHRAVPPGHSQEEEEDTYISTELCHLDTLRRRRRTHTSAQSCATWTLSLSCCRHSSSSRSHVSICMLDYYHYHYCHCCYYCCLSQCPHCNAQILNPEPSVHAGAEGIEGWSIRQ
jgi:hypothetical protein